MSTMVLAIRGLPKMSVLSELVPPVLMAGEQAESCNPSSAVPKIPSAPMGLLESIKSGSVSMLFPPSVPRSVFHETLPPLVCRIL